MKIDIHTHQISQNKDIKEIYIHDFNKDADYDPKLTCFGIHPWFIHKLDIDKCLEIIKMKMQTQDAFALGEIGLDRAIEISIKEQITILEKQLEIAQKYGTKRIVIHNVRASFDLIPILKNFKLSAKILLHDYNENSQVFDAFAKKFDTYFSCGHQLFKQSTIMKSLRSLPANKLFLESDDQETYNLNEIYLQCANILQIDQTTLENKIIENFKHFNY